MTFFDAALTIVACFSGACLVLAVSADLILTYWENK